MLRERSVVEVADNSGAVKVMLFAVNGKNHNRSARVGSIVMGSVKQATPRGKVKKGQKVQVLIVRTRNRINRRDGSSISFSDNAGVVVNKQTREPIATRVFGPVAREIRDLGFNKVVSLSEEVL
jgi:large subunit ribosomal protein L14